MHVSIVFDTRNTLRTATLGSSAFVLAAVVGISVAYDFSGVPKLFRDLVVLVTFHGSHGLPGTVLVGDHSYMADGGDGFLTATGKKHDRARARMLAPPLLLLEPSRVADRPLVPAEGRPHAKPGSDPGHELVAPGDAVQSVPLAVLLAVVSALLGAHLRAEKSHGVLRLRVRRISAFRDR